MSGVPESPAQQPPAFLSAAGGASPYQEDRHHTAASRGDATPTPRDHITHLQTRTEDGLNSYSLKFACGISTCKAVLWK